MGIVINNLILPCFVALLLLGLIKEKTLFSRLLSTPLFQSLGRSSYAFYLLHMGIFSELYFRVFDAKYILFPFMILVSTAFYYFVESPLNNWIRKLSIKSLLIRIQVGEA